MSGQSPPRVPRGTISCRVFPDSIERLAALEPVFRRRGLGYVAPDERPPASMRNAVLIDAASYAITPGGEGPLVIDRQVLRRLVGEHSDLVARRILACVPSQHSRDKVSRVLENTLVKALFAHHALADGVPDSVGSSVHSRDEVESI